MDSQTLWDQIERLARVLGSAHEALHVYVLSQACSARTRRAGRVRDWKLTMRENGEATLWAEAVTSRP